jgi:dihydrofolate synthase/folylpolyglutamate synthase
VNTTEYQATLDYLYLHLPMYQRIGAVAYKEDLTNTIALCNALGNPQTKFKSVHVAGTNGKGSSSHLIAAVLQSAGYKTGLYTSPHLKEFTERIRIDGQDVSHEFVVDFVKQIKGIISTVQPSFFETTVAMAFDYFASQKVDIAVIEVGLGGRLDSTNVITPLVSLITNIGYDHMDLLGKTLPEIASQKAGIIKPLIPVVISERQKEVESVFIEKAREEKSPIFFSTDYYQLKEKPRSEDRVYDVYRGGELVFENLECQLKGFYQNRNIPGVLMTLDKLKEQGFSISDEAIRTGLSQVVSLTGLKGRWQKIGDRPLMICDTGHNADGIRAVVEQLQATPHEKLHVILGTVNDKDIRGILELFPKEAFYYFCQAKIPRALPAGELAVQAMAVGLQGIVIGDVNEAIRSAKASASADDLIFIGGSTFVVAEVDNL